MLWSMSMPVYKLRLFAVQRLSAATDEEALSIVRGMFKEASPAAKFDLWEGERRIGGAAPIKKGKPRRSHARKPAEASW